MSQLGHAWTFKIGSKSPLGSKISALSEETSILSSSATAAGGEKYSPAKQYYTISQSTSVNPRVAKRAEERKSATITCLNALYKGFVDGKEPYDAWTWGHHVILDIPSN